MPDQFTTTTQTPWLARLKSGLAGIVLGPILIVASIILLWHNEGRSVRTATGLSEGAKSVTTLAAPSLDPQYAGRLVHFNGLTSVSGSIRDNDFSVEAVGAVRLARVVEMYQWIEKETTTSQDNLGGSQTSTTTYSYDKQWSDEKMDSAKFHDAAGHSNPVQWPYASFTRNAARVEVGPVVLSDAFVDQIPTQTTFMLPAQGLSNLSGATVSGDTIYIGANSSVPAIGDIRIRYSVAPTGPVSVLGQIEGGILGGYRTKNGTTIADLRVGTMDAQSMFAALQDENTTLTWILRAVGLILMFIGFSLIFQIITLIAKVVPFVASILSFGAWLLALLLTLVVGGSVIAIAWFVARPVITAIIVVVIGAVIFAVYSQRKKTLLTSPPTSL